MTKSGDKVDKDAMQPGTRYLVRYTLPISGKKRKATGELVDVFLGWGWLDAELETEHAFWTQHAPLCKDDIWEVFTASWK